MENKTYDFSQNRGKDAAHDAESEFYQLLAAEEREYHLVLLTNPNISRTQRVGLLLGSISLDGG